MDEKRLLRWRRGPPVEIQGLTRVVVRTLRFASEPMSSAEVTAVVLDDRGDDPSDRAFRIVLKRRVDECLWWLKKRGLVRQIAGKPNPRWMVVEEAL